MKKNVKKTGVSPDPLSVLPLREFRELMPCPKTDTDSLLGPRFVMDLVEIESF